MLTVMLGSCIYLVNLPFTIVKEGEKVVKKFVHHMHQKKWLMGVYGVFVSATLIKIFMRTAAAGLL
jgi:hypothetical protein